MLTTCKSNIFAAVSLVGFFLLSASSAFCQSSSSDHGYTDREKRKARKVAIRDSVLRTFLKDDCYCADPAKCDPRHYYYQGNQYLSTYSMNRLIRQDITKITLSLDGSPVIGNYASLQYAESNTKVTLNTSFYNPFLRHRHWETSPIKTILSVNVKASVTDGVGTLFSNKNATSGTSVTLRYSFLSPKTIYERYAMPECNDIKFYREKLLDNYENGKQNWMILPAAKRQELQAKVDKAKKAIKDYNQSLLGEQINVRKDSLRITVLDLAKESRALEQTLALIDKDETRTPDERAQLKAYTRNIKERDLLLRKQTTEAALKAMDSLDKGAIDRNSDALRAVLITAENDLNTYETTVSRYDGDAAIDSTYKLLYAAETKDVKWDYYKVKWFDIDGSIGGEKYQVFDPTMPVGQQVAPKPYTSWSGGFTFNYFESGDPGKTFKNGYFLQWGFHVSNTNNFVGASTLDVSTTDSYEAGSKKTTATDKKTAYLGPFTQSYLRSFGVRFSAYQNAKQSASLNFYNTISLPFDKNPFKFDNRPDVLLGTGYTLAFLDKDKAKSFLNVELFLNFTDMLNSNKADTKFYQRHELGLRIGVPFNSIFINK